ncbi:DNA translocase FtsK [Pontiella sulfatireligans]|uniref:DNA translocase SpoIIIE n=1 Tax=Pontiella sulfatireligans TaxID=2750658 RepID=A0A6C2UMR7_9BACT|nr:DNA translocase FtsK [Pontiella sulfatireligans]VGO21309.1 DNA translocase SpoIIIE [Pontiella sulfatireligans]
MPLTVNHNAKIDMQNPLEANGADPFSARAVRSFMSRIGSSLLSATGFEPAEADEEIEDYVDPAEEAAEEQRLQREQQLADWRTEFRSALHQRQVRQEAFAKARAAAKERVLAEAHTIRQKLHASDNEPAPATRVVEPEPIQLAEPEPVEHETFQPEPASSEAYALPGTELFEKPETNEIIFINAEELEQQKRAVQDTLDNFAVDATVWDAIVGPRVTQLRLKPGLGVRVESISSLSNNLALALAAESLRIQAPIPGMPYVGIEIPNGNTAPLNLGLMMRSEAWQKTKAAIPLMLGMELGGGLCITDLSAAPHILIAGATGSGKSVCMNTILMCLANRFTPDELELILIDPKRVEFGAYEKLPHLVRPVITEPKLVVPALQWAVREMEERYKTMASVSARNIAGYNEKMDEFGLKRMPFLVIIIDELADIMLTTGAEVETSLARIAQLSRAVGIHTIIATQRPSVNVITGMIKANFPTRIAFKVSSQIDSRTILDGRGAETLRGKGDMLFSPPGIGVLQRVQGPWVTDAEIARIAGHCAEQREQRFKTSITDLSPCEGDDSHALREAEEADPLLDQAIEIILRDQRASTSYIQRCLRVGYNRAANLIEELEAKGILGPQIGNTPREILIER